MQFNAEVDSYRNDMIRDTCSLIHIPSVYTPSDKAGEPFGHGIRQALDFCLQRAAEMGFRTVNLDGYCGYAEYGEGSSCVMAMSHLDIVDPGSGWTHEPYGADIENGRIYGRGALDNKGPAMALLYALKAIKDTGISLGRPVRIFFGTDEEGGDGSNIIDMYRDVQVYLEKEKMPLMGFTVESVFPAVYAEKGLLFLRFSSPVPLSSGKVQLVSLNGGESINTAPGKCTLTLKAEDPQEVSHRLEAYADAHDMALQIHTFDDLIVVDVIGHSQHSGFGVPQENANLSALELLGETGLFEPDVSQDWQHFHSAFADQYGRGLGIEQEDTFSGRLTTVPGILRCDGRSLQVLMDVRYPVTCNYEQMIEKLQKRAAGRNGRLEVLNHLQPLYYSPKDHFVIRTLMNAYREITGDEEHEPVTLGGSTYAKAIPNIIPFGPLLPGREPVAHVADEYVYTRDLVLMSRIYAKALYDLSNE